MIPFVNLPQQWLAYKEELEGAALQVLRSGHSVGGAEIDAFEKELCGYIQIPHAITCGSGTDALTLALLALGINRGDEVIVPDFTFIAPAECVAILGGIPRFADIGKSTYLINPASVEELITPRTKGIIAVDLFGQCADYKALRKIADAHGLWIIEDAAQSFGASQCGRAAGTFGDIAATSFYPTKPLGCSGDGGAVFTASDELAHRIRELANHGCSSRYFHERIGLNSRLDALQAAILRVKLRHLNEELPRRVRNAELYNQFFAGIPGMRTPQIAAGNGSTYAQYTLLCEDRDAFEKFLDRAGIPYCIHYPRALHRQPCFADLQSTGNPDTEAACGGVISLPVCAFTDIKEIISVFRSSPESFPGRT